jgi:hypothetical protein
MYALCGRLGLLISVGETYVFCTIFPHNGWLD